MEEKDNITSSEKEEYLNLAKVYDLTENYQGKNEIH